MLSGIRTLDSSPHAPSASGTPRPVASPRDTGTDAGSVNASQQVRNLPYLSMSLPGPVTNCPAAEKFWDASATVVKLLSGVTERAFSGLIIRLFAEALPLPSGQAFTDASRALRDIYHANTSAAMKLQDIGALLRSLNRELGLAKSQDDLALYTFRQYLSAVTPWLEDMGVLLGQLSATWNGLDLSLDMTTKAIGLLHAAEKCCLTLAARRRMAEKTMTQLTEKIRGVSLLLAKIKLIEDLPGDASFEDYLPLVSDTFEWLPFFQQTLAPIVSALSILPCASQWSPKDSVTEQIHWLITVLSDPRVLPHLRPHLEMQFGDADQVDMLLSVISLSHALTQYPGGAAPFEQARWLVHTTAHAGVGKILKGTGPGWIASVWEDTAALSLLDAFVAMDTSSQGWLDTVYQLQKMAASDPFKRHARQAVASMDYPAAKLVATQGMSWMMSYVLPLEAQAEIERFYRDSSATESWTQMLERLLSGAGRLIQKQAMSYAMDNPAAATTLHYAELIQRQPDWRMMLKFFITQSESYDAAIASVCSYFTSVLLSWKVFEALRLNDVEQCELALRSHARELKETDLVRAFPQLRKIVDLLPLLPALRQVRASVQAQDATSDSEPVTLWNRVAHWQQALLQGDTPATQAAAGQLSRCMEDWLVDAGMWACENLVQMTSTALPGADAASTESNREQSTPATDIASAKADDQGTTPTTHSAVIPVAAGGALVAAGIASLSYGLWKCNQTPDYTLVGFSPATARSRKIPVVIGIAALASGAGLLYSYLYNATSQQDEWLFVDPAEFEQLRLKYPDIATEIDRLLLPDWDTISAADNTLPGIEQLVQAQSPTPLDPCPAARKRVARAAALSPTSTLLEWFVDAANRLARSAESDDATRLEFLAIFTRCRELPRVKQAKDQESRAFMLLIKIMQGIIEITLDMQRPEDSGRHERLSKIWTALYPILTIAFAGPFRELAVSFATLYEIRSTLTPRLVAGLSPEQVETIEKTRITTNTGLITAAFRPILNPALYVDQYIRTHIAQYEMGHPAKNLTPASPIDITFRCWIGLDNPVSQTATVDIVKTFTIQEIVTGQYHYKLDGLEADKNHLIEESMAEPVLMKSLLETNLEADMEKRLEEYRKDQNCMSGMIKFHEAMIVGRCMAYLERKDRLPLFADAIEKFLTNEIQAKLLYFQGQVVTGAFCIPVGKYMALILSIDDPVSFHVYEHEYDYEDPARKKGLVSKYPITQEFTQWVYAKIPLTHAMRYPQTSQPIQNEYFTGQTRGKLFMSFHRNVLTLEPMTQSETPISRKNLPRALRDHLLSRIQADIDTMILTGEERATKELLTKLKVMLMALDFAVMVALPGTGTLLSLTCYFLVKLGLDVAQVSVSALQAQIADQPDEIDKYTNEVIWSVLMMAVSELPTGIPIANLAANRSLTVNNIRQAASVYRTVRKKFQRQGGELDWMTQPGRTGKGAGPAKASDRVIEAAPPRGVGPSAPKNSDPIPHIDVMSPYARHFERAYFHYAPSANFTRLKMADAPGTERVGYRTIGDTDYVQIYTLPSEGVSSFHSKKLVVSSHGGFITKDLPKPSIPMPASMTVEMLAPHGVRLQDPTLNVVINDPRFMAYYVVNDAFEKVSFIPQRHSDWLFGNDYNPNTLFNIRGPGDGLMNYRHMQFEYDNPFEICSALKRNRRIFRLNLVPEPSDVLVLNDTLPITQLADPKRASVEKVIEMVENGTLTNAHGEKYETITFCHCRNNLDVDPNYLSTYKAVHTDFARLRSTVAVQWELFIYQTTLSRSKSFAPITVLKALYLYTKPSEPKSTTSTV